MSSITFVPGSVPTVDWYNEVDRLVFDVFGAAATAAEARTALGLGTMALQNATGVTITGGSIEGTTIGLTNPVAGHFTGLRTSVLNPSNVQDVVPLQYLNSRLSVFTSLAQMLPSAVAITGGTMQAVAITGGSANNLVIGGTTPAAATFTTVAISTALPTTSGGTGSSTYTGKYLVYTSSPSPHFTSVSTIPVADVSGVGTMAVQNASAVAITGGTLNGVTLGTGTVFQSLGTLSQQNANAVNITGGTLTNVTIVGPVFALGNQSISGATSADASKDLFVCTANSADYLVDLPNPAVVKKPLYFKKRGAFAVGLRAPVGVTVDGDPVYSLFQDRESVILVSDGANYFAF